EKPIIALQNQLDDLLKQSAGQEVDVSSEIQSIREKLEQLKESTYCNLNAWQRVQIARHPTRPYMLDYVSRCFGDFLEVFGDRHMGDDSAMPGGFATIG